MYKYVSIAGSCGNGYSLKSAESVTNQMAAQGMELVQAFQSTTPGCFGSNSALVMVFKQRDS